MNTSTTYFVEIQQAERPIVATLDIGTSSVRALLFDAHGRQIRHFGVQHHHQPTVSRAGASEFCADELLDRCIEVLVELAGQSRLTPDAIGMSAFWHSLVGVNKADRAITPLYLWSDTRSREYVDVLRNRLDEGTVHARTGCLFHTSYLPARLLWLQKEYRDQYDEAVRWLAFPDYLWLRLFGTAATSHSMASGSGLFHLNNLRWDETLLSALSLTQAQLPQAIDFNEPFTNVLSSFAQQLNDWSRVPWFLALGDGACSNVGSGCVTSQQPAIMIGTSGAMRTVWTTAAMQPTEGLWAYRLDRNRFVVGGALSNGGNLIQWFKETFNVIDVSAFNQQLSNAAPAQHGLTVLPFLAGERSPGWSSHATGAIVGLRFDTKPEHVLQAIMESVAYRFYLILQLLEQTVDEKITSLVGTGGGLLRSPVWQRIISDTLNKPLYVSHVPEASSRGAALMVLEALGVYNVCETEPTTTRGAVQPRTEYHTIHMAAQQRQAALYRKMLL